MENSKQSSFKSVKKLSSDIKDLDNFEECTKCHVIIYIDFKNFNIHNFI